MTIGINKETIGSAVALVLVGAGGWYVLTSGPPLPGSGPAAAGAAGVVALVNGEAISRGALDTAETQLTAKQATTAPVTAEVQATIQTQALDVLIGRALLAQAAEGAGFSASTTVVEAQVEATREQLGSQDAFDKALVAQGLTEESYRRQMAENLVISEYLEYKLTLSLLTGQEQQQLITALVEELRAAGDIQILI